MKRFRVVEVVGEAVRAKSNIIRGYRSMPVQVRPWWVDNGRIARRSARPYTYAKNAVCCHP